MHAPFISRDYFGRFLPYKVVAAILVIIHVCDLDHLYNYIKVLSLPTEAPHEIWL